MLIAPAAQAQFMASQGGNALSANLARNNPYAGAGRDFAAEAKYRNSVVFSQAPGGFAFRGRLGYSDPAEFVGALGTSSLNSFKRNSELSTIASQGLKREQTFGAQNALSIGGPASRAYLPGQGVVNYNSFNVPRTGYGQPGITQGAGGVLPSLANSAASRMLEDRALQRDGLLDRNYAAQNRLARGLNTGAALGGPSARLSGLGTSSAYSDSSRGGDISDRLGMATRSTAISSLDFGRNEIGAGRLDADRTLASAARQRGMTERSAGEAERSRTRVDALRPGTSAGGRIETSAKAKPGADVLKGPQEGATVLGQNTSFDDLRQKLDKYDMNSTTPDLPGTKKDDKGGRESGGPTSDGKMPDWQRRLDDLRSHLQKQDEKSRDRMSLLDQSKVPARPGEKKPDSTGTGLSDRAPRDGADTTGDRPLRSRIDPDTLKMIRDVAGPVDSFVPSDSGRRDFYTDHMKTGQKLLADRMYFDAEERFTRALSSRPGDVSARTGQIHAQVGAGLFLSAGQHLRQLLAEHPETTGQRYAQSLRPDVERTMRVIEQLRENIAGTGKLRRESALLIAYLGFQAGDMTTAREGLDAMAQVATEDPDAKSDERLVELLRGVWLDPNLYVPAPGAAPVAPATPAPREAPAK